MDELEPELKKLIQEEAAKLHASSPASWWCRHGLHKWSNWEQTAEGRYKESGMHWVSVRRVCVRCGLPNLRELCE